MSAAPEFDPRGGQLWLDEHAFATLAEHACNATEMGTALRGDPEAVADRRQQLPMLRGAGALDDNDRPHPALTPTLEAIRNASAQVDLSYAGRTMQAWIAGAVVAVLMPIGREDGYKLTYFPLSLFPEVLARLVGLGPRPRPEPARPLRYPSAGLGDIRRHWRVRATRAGDDGTVSVTEFEVVDAATGLWGLRPGSDGHVVAWPSTPSRVMREFVRMVNCQDTLAAPL